MEPLFRNTDAHDANRNKLKRPRSQKARQTKPTLVNKLKETWLFEAVAFLVAAGCLAATVLLLRAFDGQPVPKWPFTLNFVVSLLGTVASAATLFGANSGIAQLKWAFFSKRPRKLVDLSTFQNARGGPAGAVELLPLAMFGALAIILAVLWDPFTQNVIRYENANIASSTDVSLLARSIEYSTQGPPLDYTDHYLDPRLLLNMQSTLITATNTDLNTPTFFCSTGNCTWDPFATLAFCSSCADISSGIEVDCTSSGSPGDAYHWMCSSNLPNDVSQMLLNPDGTSTLMNITNVGGNALVYKDSTGIVFQSVRLLEPWVGLPNFRGLGARLRSFTERDTDQPPVSPSNYSATECTLSPCVLSLQAEVSKGIYRETILDTWMEGGNVSLGRFHPLNPPWGPEQGLMGNQSFGWSPETNYDWLEQGFPEKAIAGWVETNDGNAGVRPSGGELQQFIYYANFSAATCGSPNDDTFACAMQAVAASLTKTLRDAGVNANGTRSADLVAGQALASTTLVHVQWYWLALPLAVWLLGLATWLGTAAQSAHQRLPKWRDNILPLLFLYRHGEQTACSEELHGNAIWAYEDLAKHLRVRLRPDDQGMLRFESRERDSNLSTSGVALPRKPTHFYGV
ncbi:hypothetical protein CONLIGDRAFT_583766 [Coniochaeta ligniaria NRRL 30616]|uniref:Uncharacterized protein n=1 Tax=Coniochaeta ligniaria NRRL 30616 TaxID=1408157 RepID=A0A1J7IBQ8_9PEZI|nr:hypothetical protein CONLIGDRAFT_583766 [Coniochaeta ligniaria NRRL 30616]